MFRRLFLSGVFLFVVFVSWRNINLATNETPGWWDSGVFASAGFFLTTGEKPYKDFFDHKPPMIFLINALAQEVHPETTNSIRYVQRWFCLFIGLAIFLFSLLIFESWLSPLAVFAGLVGFIGFSQLNYEPRIFWDGNLATSYGAVFNIWGALFYLFSSKTSNIWVRWGSMIVGSLLLGLTLITKEPFIFTIAPCIFLLIPFFKKWRENKLFLSLAFALVLLPWLLMVSTFMLTGIFQSWVEIMQYNFAYARSGYQGHVSLLQKFISNWILSKELFWRGSKIWVLMPLLGLMATLLRFHMGDLDDIDKPQAVWLFFYLVLGFWACGLSGHVLPHYYTQLIPAMIVATVFGIKQFNLVLQKYILVRQKKISKNLSFLIIAAFIVLTLDVGDLKGLVKRIKTPFSGERAAKAFSIYIKNNTLPSDTIWAPSMNFCPTTELYYESQRKSASRYFYTYSTIVTMPLNGHTTLERESEIMNDLIRNRPKFIVTDDAVKDFAFLSEVGVPQWVIKNYTRIEADGTKVYKRIHD